MLGNLTLIESTEGKSAFKVADHLTDIFMRKNVIMGTSGGGGETGKFAMK